MPTVTCPSCGEKGKIPPTLVGSRIKCRKCATSFLVAPATPKTPAATPEPSAALVGAVAAGKPRNEDQIEVDGLDDAAWSSTPVVTEEHDHDHDHPEHHHDDSHNAFSPHPESASIKQYKILTPKDKYFEGKFDLEKLEQALNHFARQGWVVKGMSTPHVAGFSGGDKEVLVIVLER